MKSGIGPEKKQLSWTSRNEDGSGSTTGLSVSLRNAPIPEETSINFQSPPPTLLSPSENQLQRDSPLPISPGIESGSESFPSLTAQSDPNPQNVPTPSMETQSESCDPHLLNHHRPLELSASDQPVIDQLEMGSSDRLGEVDENGIFRRDTALSAEERNARLEKLEEEDGKRMEKGWGKPFAVEWIKVARLPFHRTRHLSKFFLFFERVHVKSVT
jgi:hypothetical protein